MQFFQSVFMHLPTLKTTRLTLRPLRMSDAEDMFAYSSDDEVSRHVLWETHKSLSDTRAFLRGAKRQYRLGMPGTFAIVLNETGRMIGTIGFMWVNLENKSAEVGYSLSRVYWNQGMMTEALTAVLRFGFETLHLNRIEAQHEVDNPSSGRVMQKCGLQLEGILRQRVYNKGHFSDVALYAMLRQDRAQKQMK